MHRVFFFSGYRLKLFYWQHSRLQGALTFEPNDEGFEKFESYLEATRQEPAAFLVDLIEEDYYPKELAQCSGASRRALIKRALTQQFRDERYTCAIYQGPVKEGTKKQNAFLLSALTNPSIMDPWLGRIRKAGVAVTGIYSVAHLMPKLLPKLHVKRRYVLLITQEVGTALRQSFFDNKKLLFSRQAKLPRGACDSGSGLAYACVLTSEIEQTIHYLEIQRQVKTDDLEVHCLVPSEHHAVLAAAFKKANESAHFIAHDLGRFQPHKHLSDDLADSLFAWHCARLPAREKHYTMPEDVQRFDAYQLTQRLTWAAAVVTVCATLTSLVFALQAQQANESAQQLSQQGRQLQDVFEREFGGVRSELSMAEQVRDAVLLAARVEQTTHITPQDFFKQISNIMSAPEFDSVTLNSIEWRKGLGGEGHFDDLVALKMSQNPDFDPFLDGDAGEEAEANEEEVNIGVISGKFNITRDSSYRRVVALANTFVSAIEAHDRVQRVDVLTLPVEHRHHKQFIDEVSQELEKTGGLSIDGSFKFRIIMRGPVNV